MTYNCYNCKRLQWHLSSAKSDLVETKKTLSLYVMSDKDIRSTLWREEQLNLELENELKTFEQVERARVIRLREKITKLQREVVGEHRLKMMIADKEDEIRILENERDAKLVELRQKTADCIQLATANENLDKRLIEKDKWVAELNNELKSFTAKFKILETKLEGSEKNIKPKIEAVEDNLTLNHGLDGKKGQIKSRSAAVIRVKQEHSPLKNQNLGLLKFDRLFQNDEGAGPKKTGPKRSQFVAKEDKNASGDNPLAKKRSTSRVTRK